MLVKSKSAINLTAQKTVEGKKSELHEISVYLSDNPELCWKEVLAHEKLTTYLEEQGFEVTRKYKFDTAFRASFTHGKGGRTFGLNSEYDALPAIGHGCGHNLIAITGVAALMAMRAAMIQHNIEGKVVLLGTPAEEGGSGKVHLIDAGAYKEMDACMMLHPGKVVLGNSCVSTSFATTSVDVEYIGKPAHAAAFPWQGVNALDAAVIAYTSVSAMRQQFMPEDRIHSVILNGGDAVNVIPEYTKSRFQFRSLTAAGVERMKAKLIPIFEQVPSYQPELHIDLPRAAASATGCQIKMTWRELMKDLHHSEGLGDAFRDAMDELFDIPVQTAYGKYVGGGSTDFGNVTYEMPASHPHFGIVPELGRGPHTGEFEVASRGDVAHEEAYKAATGMACVGLRLLKDADFAAETRRHWENDFPNGR